MLTKRGLQNIHGKLSGQSGDDITRSLAGQALLQLETLNNSKILMKEKGLGKRALQ